MPAHNITMEACAEANTYTIVFDPNDGTAVSPIPDITVKYDEEVILPDILLSDGTAAYIKYTLDGVIVTDKILSGEIVIDEYGTVVMQAADGYPEGSMIAADGTPIAAANSDNVTSLEYTNTPSSILAFLLLTLC